MRVAAAQTPDFRDDVSAALTYLRQVARDARRKDVDLLCLPEAFLQGYLIAPSDTRRIALAIDSAEFRALLEHMPAGAPAIVLGMIEREGESVYNTAVVIRDREVAGRYRKHHLLPAERAFDPGTETEIFTAGRIRFGINICYDTNFPEGARRIAALGASLLVCPSNNMMKRPAAERFRAVHNSVRGERCRETGLWLLSADVTGEHDDRVSWGPTALLDPEGHVVDQLPLGRPGLLIADIPASRA